MQSDDIFDRIGAYFSTLVSDGVPGIVSEVESGTTEATVWIVIEAVLIIALIVSLFLTTFPLTRYFVRFFHHKLRVWFLGGMVFNEIIYEGSTGKDISEQNVKSLVDNTQSIMPLMPGVNFHIFWHRPMTTFILRNDPDTETLRIFIGFDKKHYSPDRVRSWAEKMNCTAEEVPLDEIGIVTGAPRVSWRSEFYPNNTASGKDMEDSHIGSVISRIQSLSTRDYPGTLILSYEPMRDSETDMTIQHVSMRARKTSGQSGDYSRNTERISTFSGKRTSRGTMMAFSDYGDESVSSEILSVALNNMGTSLTQATCETPQKGIRDYATPWSILMILAPLPPIAWLMGLNIVHTIIFCAIVAVLVGIGPKFLAAPPLSWAAKTGVSPIPPFFRFSLARWVPKFMMQVFRGKKFQELQRSGGYVEQPSCREIIPLYLSPVMQVTSIPQNTSGTTNLSVSPVPQVSMPDSVNRRIEQEIRSDQVVYAGISAKTFEPVYLTYKDLNYGIAVGGSPGSGKTNFLDNLFVGMSRLSQKEDNFINPIWFETKPDDISSLIKLVEPYDPLVVRLHDGESEKRLALEGPRFSDGASMATIEKNISALVDMMEAVWGSSLGNRSRAVISSALHVAMLMTIMNGMKILEIAPRVKNPKRPNILQVTNILVGGDPSLDIEKKLEVYHNEVSDTVLNEEKMNKIRSKPNGEKAESALRTLRSSLSALLSMHKTPGAVDPIKNKISALASSPGMWETVTPSGEKREEYSLDRFINHGGPVILDMTVNNIGAGQSTARIYTMGTHYMLWKHMYDSLSGKAAQGHYYPIFADEVSNFVGVANSETGGGACTGVITEVRNQGRSFGVSHNVGFQEYGQLPTTAKSAISGFESAIFFKFGNVIDQEQAIRRLSSNRFTEENLKFLPKNTGICIADLTIGTEQVRSFTMKVPYVKDFAEAVETSDSMITVAEELQDSESSVLRSERHRKVDMATKPETISRMEDEARYEDQNRIDPMVQDDYYDFVDGE